MTATSLQFGPEWMRTKQQTTPSTTRPPTSVLSPVPQSTAPPAPPGASSYSSLLTPPVPAPPEKRGSINPFMYSKEEMLQVWKDGGGRGGLGLEVELWEGVVKEIGGEPIGLREISEAERKLFSSPLNSDLRRRQSHDFLPSLTHATGDRQKLPHSASNTHSSLSQQRFGGMGSRRRKDEDSGQPHAVPRRLSLSSVSSPLGVPLSPTTGALSSPRTRLGSGTNVLEVAPHASDGSWRKRDIDVARTSGHVGGSNDLDERDEETEEGKKQSSSFNSSGSPKDLDVSRSSDRSMAPSPPSFRGDSGQGHTEDFIAKLSGVALVDEQRNAGAVSGPLENPVDGNSAPSTQGGISVARPPGLEDDPANVSWSYRDPKGNIQGPFAATLMQKWYDDGYFSPDLLMKRTHVDTDWTAVGELCLRAGSERLFFSSFADPGPPGLAPRPAAPSIDGQPLDRFGQPIGQTLSLQPQRPSSELSTNGPHLRTPVSNRNSNLDSYLVPTPSNPSESPVSAFTSAIGPMSSTAPDLPFGVGATRSPFGNNGLEPAFGGRVGAFDSQPSSLGARGVGTAFNATSDPSFGPRLASLGHRGAMVDNQGFTNIANSGNSALPWTTGVGGSAPRNPDTPALVSLPTQRPPLNNGVFGHSSVTSIPGFNEMGNPDSSMFGTETFNFPNTGFSQLNRGIPPIEALPSHFGPIGPGIGLRDQSLRIHLDMDGAALNSHHGLDENPRVPGSFVNGYGSTTSPVVHGQGSGFGITGNQGSQQHGQHSTQHIPPIPVFNQSPVPASPLAVLQPQQQTVPNLPVVQPPWGAPEVPAQPRPHPFDAPHPTSRNVVRTPITPNDTSLNNRQQTSEWYNPSIPGHDDGWGDVSAQTPENNQSNDTNQGQPSGLIAPPRTSPPSFDHVSEQGQVPRSNPAPPEPQPAQPQVREPTPQIPPKKRGSVPAAQAVQSQVSKPAPPTSGGAPKPPSPLPLAPTPVKPAWSTTVAGMEDEVKPTKQVGLREIQEAEAKRVEARKATERERERIVRAQPQEETQTYTASWGLPTSQVGTARSTPKEQPSLTSTTSQTPVWTNPGKPPQTKRTMKEIQEEEERRKKAATREKETASAAARRAYADSANKTSSSSSAGGAWTTVGSGGKSNTNPSATRQIPGSAQPASTPPALLRPSNGTPPTARASAPPQKAKPSASKSAPADDSPVPPSPEFMKWLREAVRGFNPGFNTEEFMAMLLTFSLDFPPSTVEMIQDMVYMNSATLDGRRFAADFCSRRKADAANRPKSVTAVGKTPSLADVVKTQPKPAQTEFGFKMVKKKGRSNALR